MMRKENKNKKKEGEYVAAVGLFGIVMIGECVARY